MEACEKRIMSMMFLLVPIGITIGKGYRQEDTLNISLRIYIITEHTTNS